jgi:hypothetical protein
MAYDGKGDYNLPTPEYPAISGTLILAVDYNTILSDLAAALSDVLVRDGQAPMTGPLAMGGQKITGLADGVNPQDAATVLQVFTSPDFTDATMLGTTFTVSATTTTVASAITISGTALTVTSTTVTLPANTSIGTVSATEIGYLDGVTSGLQGQLDLKAPLASPALTGIPTVPTAAPGTSTKQAASTEFVQITAFSAALPFIGPATAGLFVTNNGTTANWGQPAPDPLLQFGII